MRRGKSCWLKLCLPGQHCSQWCTTLQGSQPRLALVFLKLKLDPASLHCTNKLTPRNSPEISLLQQKGTRQVNSASHFSQFHPRKHAGNTQVSTSLKWLFVVQGCKEQLMGQQIKYKWKSWTKFVWQADINKIIRHLHFTLTLEHKWAQRTSHK